MLPSPWFIRAQPRPHAGLRLFCVPHAGGGASAFRPWAAELPADVELWAVQLPGRETRLREPPFDRLQPLVEALTEQIVPHLDRPFSLFGHSMGACVAFELAHALRARGAPAPSSLIVSGRRAPSRPSAEPPLHDLPDDAFVAEIRRRYGGIPDGVLQHPDLLALLLPTMRADIAALERHGHLAAEPLDCPILALGGTADRCISVADLEAWRRETCGPFSLRLFPGAHFYLQSARAQVVATVADALRAQLRNPEVQWIVA